MSDLKKVFYCMAFFSLLTFVPPALGQENEGETGTVEKKKEMFSLREVVVSATKSEIDPRETGASITIITQKDIEKKGKATVAELLSEVPGLTVFQNGSFGGSVSIYMRGSKSGNVLVLVDGVRVNDPMAIGKHFDFAHLQTINIERIEVIRGPQSTLYGSDATGGVINIITKKGKGKNEGQITLEAGSYDTFKESFSLFGGNEAANYAFGIARTDSKGMSKADRAPGAVNRLDKDGYRNTAITSKVGFKLPYGILLNTGFYYSDSRAEIDDGSFDDDPSYISWIRTLSAYTELRQNVFNWWEHKLTYGYASSQRKNRDQTDPATEPDQQLSDWYDGIFQKLEWQHVFNILNITSITAGAEFGEERGSSTYHSEDTNFFPPPAIYTTHTEFNERSVRTIAWYAQNHLKLFDRVYHIIGIRVDDHEEFGTKTSWQTSLSVIAPFTDTRFKANYSTGFKAPSLYELYDVTYGNRDLKPEENRNIDAGFEQPFLKNMIIIGATYFKNRYRNMIDFVTRYENIGRVETEGIETEAKIKFPIHITFMGTYTYTKTEDKKTGKRLVRRPEHQASFSLNWELPKSVNITLSLLYIGERDDTWYDSSWTKHEETMDPYCKLDLYASYWITSFLQVFGRIENLTDERYQAVVGYKSPERSYYGGVKGVF